MSIARAIHEIEVADGQSPPRHVVFRSQQRQLDRLIGEAEQLVMTGAASSPPTLVQKAGRVLTQIHGRVPSWLTAPVPPVALLDHLLVAEGSLRKRYYRGVDLDLEDGN